MGRAITALLLLVVIPPAAASADRSQRTDAYIALVEQYRTGESGSAVTETAKWTDEELADVLGGLPEKLRPYWDGFSQIDQKQPTTLDVAREPNKPTPLELLATAMLLHANVARHADGHAIGRHLDFGLSLSELGAQLERKGHRITRSLPDAPERSRFTALWHVLAGTIAIGSLHIDRAGEHFEVAQRFRGDDPAVLLAAGSYHEMLASLLGPDHSRRDLTRTRPYTEMSAEAHLKRASDAYERALAVDPALWEPRLRYARVAHLLGRTERAEVEIARVLQHAPSGGPEYLARLIAGTVAEARGHPADAIAQYRRACYLCDECQSANLALSHALLRAGDQSSAVRVVDRLLELASPLQPNDPWWTYHRGQWPSVDALLQQVRKAVPR